MSKLMLPPEILREYALKAGWELDFENENFEYYKYKGLNFVKSMTLPKSMNVRNYGLYESQACSSIGYLYFCDVFLMRKIMMDDYKKRRREGRKNEASKGAETHNH